MSLREEVINVSFEIRKFFGIVCVYNIFIDKGVKE